MTSLNNSLIFCVGSAISFYAKVRKFLHHGPRPLLRSGVNSFRGACCCTLPRPLPYLVRATSTTLSIKVSKANNAPSKRQISANVIFAPYMRRDCRSTVVGMKIKYLNRLFFPLVAKP